MQKSAGSPTRKAKPEPSATPAMYVAEYIGSGNVDTVAFVNAVATLIDTDHARVKLRRQKVFKKNLLD